jgi:hypothetical protein
MGRFVNAAPQYIDTDGSPLSGGQLFFYVTDTSGLNDTYTDSSLGTANSNPVILDTSGTIPDVYLDPGVIYRVQILRANGTLFDDKNDIVGLNDSGIDVLGGLPEWNSTVNYTIPDVVIRNSSLYESISAGTNFDPLTNPSHWSQFTHLKIWNTAETYALNDIVQQDGIIYRSRTGTSNQGKSPDANTDFWANTSGIGEQTIYLPARAMVPTLSDGALQGSSATLTGITLSTLDFDPDLKEFAQFDIEFPDSWDGGTVELHIDWSTTSSSTLNVIWDFQTTFVTADASFEQTFGAVSSVTQANIGAKVRNESAAVSLTTNAAAGDLIFFQISRDAANVLDTLPADARIHSAFIRYNTVSSTD